MELKTRSQAYTMEKEVPFTSKIRKHLESIAAATEYSEEWNTEMEAFLPFLAETLFCTPFSTEIDEQIIRTANRYCGRRGGFWIWATI